ncbi:ATP-binding cassette domain-containing protein, partial [Turicimonas muris]
KLSFSYPRQPEIITDASLEFQQGICGIFGDNGAGKTTLARLITGLNKAKSGTFQVKGKTIRQKDCLKHVAVVLQNSDHQLYMRTVFEELRASLEAAGCKGGNDAAEELLGIFDLQELRDRHPHSLSGGQKQRLVIACAFAKKPDVIILDEPTSGLDGANLKRIAGALKKLSSEGKAVLVITHDLELVDLICDTALHLPLPVQTANQPFIN